MVRYSFVPGEPRRYHASVFPMTTSTNNWRHGRRFQPLFFLFLILGPFVILPFLALLPALTTLRSAWNKRPAALWRSAVFASVVTAVMLTQPSSPIFLGLNAPILPSPTPDGPIQWLLEEQRPYLNAAIISLFVFLPLSAVSTLQTLMERREITTDSQG